MYTNDNLDIIEDNQAFTHSNGNKYPSNYQKDEIAGLYPVTLTDKPTGAVVVKGFHIDETHTQVWDYREKTSDELAEEKRQSILNDILSLEAQVTARRRDEAMLSGDYSFIADIRKQIEVKRNELKGL